MLNPFDYFKPWKITSGYDLAYAEIKKEELKENEKWKITYSINPERLLEMTKVYVTDGYWSSLNMSEKIKQHCEWPLFTYVVSEMEVVTE